MELNRAIHKAIRWIHVYLSLLGFFALFFFAVTGLTLNHAAWFEGDESKASEFSGTIDAGLVAPELSKTAIDRLKVAEWLRSRHALRGIVHDFLVDEDACTVVFKGPGYTADASIDRSNGNYKVFVTARGAMSILDDLHKGRDSGPVWSWVVDVSAVVMTIAAVTGLWLVFYVRRWRTAGLWLTLLGTLAVCAAYVLGVR